LGQGLAALFVTTHSASIPPAVEILSALTGMTSREARVALTLAAGRTTNETAEDLGISVNTLRKHLASAFDKASVNSQQALTKFVDELSLPLRND
jgi:DNA-binding CsgD family transcriptional regulator